MLVYNFEFINAIVILEIKKLAFDFYKNICNILKKVLD